MKQTLRRLDVYFIMLQVYVPDRQTDRQTGRQTDKHTDRRRSFSGRDRRRREALGRPVSSQKQFVETYSAPFSIAGDVEETLSAGQFHLKNNL